MSNNYETTEFVSAEPLFAEVKESLKSYFESGTVDDVMFPIWTSQCLKKFYRSALPIKQGYISVQDYEGMLPVDFKYVREAWLCTDVQNITYQNPSSYYYQRDCRVQADYGNYDRCEPCPTLSCDPCDQKFVVTNKITSTIELSYKRKYLLKPGTIVSRNCCYACSPNLTCDSNEVFDIKDGKFLLNVPTGSIHLEYYAENADEELMVPDIFRVQDYIRKYLMFRVFETISNSVTDETFNQIQSKLQWYDRQQGEALIEAYGELKKQTLEQKMDSFKRTKNRYNRYYIR